MRQILWIVIVFCLLVPTLVPTLVMAKAGSIALTKNHSGHYLAQVMINGQGPFDFVVDTAASRTVISPALAAQLALPVIPDHMGRIWAAGGAMNALIFQIDSLGLGGAIWDLGTVPALPGSSEHRGYSGILGLDVLASQSLMLNFETRELSFIDRKNAAKLRRNRDWHQFRAQRNFAGFLSVILRIDGHRVKAIIDSGARQSIGNSLLGPYLDDLGAFDIINPDQFITGLGLPKLPAQIGIASPAKLRKLRWEDAPILVADLDVFNTLQLADEPALILGLDFLQGTSAVVLDFANEKLWVKPSTLAFEH